MRPALGAGVLAAAAALVLLFFVPPDRESREAVSGIRRAHVPAAASPHVSAAGFQAEPPEGRGAAPVAGPAATTERRPVGLERAAVEADATRSDMLRVSFRYPSGRSLADLASVQVETWRENRWVADGRWIDSHVFTFHPPSTPFRLRIQGREVPPQLLGPFDPSSIAGELVLTIERYGRLRGVVSCEGRGVADAFVRARWPVSPVGFSLCPPRSAHTDENGVFTLPILDSADVELAVEHSVLGKTRTAPIHLEVGLDAEVAIELDDVGGLEATVLLPPGTDPRNLRLELFGRAGRELFLPETIGGSFVVERLAAGTWFAQARHAYESASEGGVQAFVIDSEGPIGPPLPVRIERGRTSRVLLDFSRLPEYLLRGFVHVDQELPPELVPAARSGSLRCGIGHRDFELVHLPSGTVLAEDLDRAGGFEIELHEAGPYRLLFSPSALAAWDFTEELVLRPGEEERTLELSTALLRIHDLAGDEGRIELVWRNAGGLVGRSRARSGLSPSPVLVPAGELELFRAGDGEHGDREPIARVRIEPGEVLDVELPPR